MNDQVEGMNRAIKEAVVYRCYYVSSEKLKQHLHTFLNAYHFAKRLKTLKGLTPYGFIKDYWTQKFCPIRRDLKLSLWIYQRLLDSKI